MRDSLFGRLLGLSLFGKILIANSAVVTLGAVVGTYLTTAHVKASPYGTHYEIMALVGGAGLTLSVLCNALVLRAAFRPLDRLEDTARRVSTGDLAARVQLGAVRDPHTEQLATSFNTMLESLQAHTRRLEAYSVRLQELSDTVLLAQEDERRRLARELHDETGQELSSLLLGLKLFRDAANRPHPDVAALRTQAAALTELTRGTLDGVRRLALELRPRMLDDLGLAPALRAYVDEWSARTGVPATYRVELESAPSLPALLTTTEVAVYRLVQEALVNVAKHAGASAVTVALTIGDGALHVRVQDNGRGMDLSRSPARPDSAPAVAPEASVASNGLPGGLSAGVGLFGIHERIALTGGQLTVESARGQGTCVHAVIPLQFSSMPKRETTWEPRRVQGLTQEYVQGRTQEIVGSDR
jgi:two-component system, NarL family, sensor histidine kinase UhpB